MSKATPATRALQQAKTPFETVEYDYDPGGERVGLQAADAIGADPAKVLKTLMVEVDDKPACVVIPSDQTLSMKKVAAAFGGKSAAMMPPAKAERLTGFHTGGISPFGQKKRVQTAFEISAIGDHLVHINGGRRGLMLYLNADAAVTAAGAKTYPLTAD
ncbi:aminoacyl-tRNA deacylase [Thalassobius vesicularis]|uniref:Cys-tRNA(Pro)/Cys-tRNA(Cys) deacylase n=1 Tax=Thalassobius vesicularis TaxID=1294297 RepID=A0A4S3MCF1_9RHOB|nr:aminoacyl-tRNA deacylase [Thalassobius vesicularis]THD75055.1 aminoacyl-tRNA deacylase [Thalassobius vesicularis]